MKKTTYIKALVLAFAFSSNVMAGDDTPSTNFESTLKAEYKLSDEQIKTMTDKGLEGNDMVRVARLSQKSGKTLDEVMAMRLNSKMGWGKIAKELGVHPSELGHSVSDAHHDKNAERKADKMEKKLERDTSKAEKSAAKAEKREGKKK